MNKQIQQFKYEMEELNAQLKKNNEDIQLKLIMAEDGKKNNEMI